MSATDAKSYPRPGSANRIDQEFINLEDIQAFGEALANDPSDAIVSVPDWAPIKQRIQSLRSKRDVVRNSVGYLLSRWPLLFLLSSLITFEFILYILVRQAVNLIEYGSYWGKRARLRSALQTAANYPAWKAAALRMDNYLGFSQWKKSAPYTYYDSHLIRRVRDNLHSLRLEDDIEGLKTVLEICLRANFAGIESPRLYSETYFGTKDLIEDYHTELELGLQYIRQTTALSSSDKAVFYRSISRYFGASALCLSGGATFGYYHFGIVKALLDADLMPRVISGTSAGALVAAFVCCRTDDELRALLNPELASRMTALESTFSEWSKRFWKTGARFDAVDWAAKACFFTLGSMTFKEAYERTGRVLNVSVIPYETHSPTKLLNYLTAPDCVIYSATIASAAVPGLLQPVVLMNKTKSGKLVPWQFQGRHKDGSLRVDIPLENLHLLFNCNFSIVSQVNPHISLFFFQPRGAPGRPVSHRGGTGWRGGFLLSAAEQFLKIELKKNFRVIRDLELMPEFGGQNWSGVFLQRFEGSVTVFPKTRFKDWLRLLTDPDERELERMIDVGKRVTWPKLHMIANRMKIEREIDQGKREARDGLRNEPNAAKVARDALADSAEIHSAFETDSDLESYKGKRSIRKRVLSRRIRPEIDVDTQDDSSANEQVDPKTADSDPQDAPRSPTQSRKQDLIKRLGLKSGYEHSRSASARLSQRSSTMADTVIARRRLSMGSLRLAERISGNERTQVYSSDDTEEDDSSD